MHRYFKFSLIIVVFIIVFYGIAGLYSPSPFGEPRELRKISLENEKTVSLKYSGTSKCLDCHLEFNEWNNSLHQSISCESCHNAGILHAEINDDAPEVKGEKCKSCHNNTISITPSMIKVKNEICETCHILDIKLDMGIAPQVDLKNHSKNLECRICHDQHYPRINLNLAPFIPHLTENKLDCRLCHSEGSDFTIFSNDHKERPNSICLTCHNISAGNKEEITHIISGRFDCLFCHNTDSIDPIKSEHPAIPIGEDSCLNCHGAGGIKPRSSEHTQTFVRKDLCKECHGLFGIYPLSEEHVERDIDTCLKCHRGNGI